MDELDAARGHLSQYFYVHAAQRLTTFNFFIVIATLISTGMVTSLQKGVIIPHLSLLLGIVLICLCFIFWRLDHRNRELIKLAEGALRKLEARMFPDAGHAPFSRIFNIEEETTAAIRLSRRFAWSYSRCFDAVFLIFAIIGGAGALASVTGHRFT